MIPGYDIIEELTRSELCLLYRGRRREDACPVLIKIPRHDAPRASDVAALEAEFHILQSLSITGVTRALSLVRYDPLCALVLEDGGGTPLQKLLASGVPEPEVAFDIMIQLTVIVDELHRHNVVHQNINPDTILVNGITGTVELAGFSLASRLSAETYSAQAPPLLVARLPYLSPEQTGRMNRTIDYRTDFYSLGVVFYELLTGASPFQSADALELIHWHIARTPRAPHETDARIPEPLSLVVMKLLAKTAEQRYQSASGLRTDLERCTRQWALRDAIEPFTPGADDVPDRFTVPQQLYGRERELEALLGVFDEVCDGPSALMLVAGYSGIGKTSLIHELYKPIARQRGYFVAGKFDQLARHVPFRALIQALRGLMQRLLTEDEDRRRTWRARLEAALGQNGAVLAEVIPEIELILGRQPPAPTLGPAEAQNRFTLVFQNFIAALAAPAHPLVVFLDDLQWADPATLGLLMPLLTAADIRGLFFLGAYRDNEVGSDHPLVKTLDNLKQAGARVHRITLPPLQLPDVSRLVQETLRSDAGHAHPLAELVLRKTDGNPFFVIQFLKTLHQERLIAFDYAAKRWIYRMEAIAAAAMTDNVIDLMTRKIQRLAPETQRVLTLAACIGNRFDLKTLSVASEQPPAAIAVALREAVQEGLVLPDENRGSAVPLYAFVHDRIQQAAYALIPDDRKQLVRLTVGRLLLAEGGRDALEERLFDVVNHLNFGSALMTEATERRALAELNLAAGRKAKLSTAYRTALGYFSAGVALLEENSWDSDYRLAYDLHLEEGESEHLCGNFDRAEDYFRLLLERARGPLDKAQVHLMRLTQYENMSRFADAVRAGKEGLALFDVSLPETPQEKQEVLNAELRAIQDLLGARPIESLVDLPVLDDPEVKAVMHFLTVLWAPTYINGDLALASVLSAKMTRLSLVHGNTGESAYGYVTHAITVGSTRGDYRSGYEFGRLALAVNERLKDTALRAKVHQQFGAHVNLWCMPFHTCLPHAREAYRAGLENGDFAYATYGLFVETWYAFLTSDDLVAFQREYAANPERLKKIRMMIFIEMQQIILNWGLALQGLTRDPISLTDANFDQDAYLERHQDDRFFQAFLYVPLIQLAFTAERYADALATARQAGTIIACLDGTIWPVLLDVYTGLTLAALYGNAPETERPGLIEELRSRADAVRVRADNCPENFLSQLLLLDAEIARLEQRYPEAIELYERAICHARATGNVRNEALANELCAKFWLHRQSEKMASPYMRSAYEHYGRWGAMTKVCDLESRYGNLLAQEIAARAAGVAAPGPAVTAAAPPDVTAPVRRHSESDRLDFATVTKAAHAIAAEIVLDDLLKRLLDIALENAGAQRGLFLEMRAIEPVIRAEIGPEDEGARVVDGVPLAERGDISGAVVNYVRTTRKSVVIADGVRDDRFADDAYIVRYQPKSILCVPIVHQGELNGMLYLENNLSTDAFTSRHIEIMQILATQAAISLENARLYADMKQEIEQRRQAEGRLRAALQELEKFKNRLQAENIYLQEEIQREHNFEEIVGGSPALLAALHKVEQVARTDATVLIQGETGTGKELIARAIHNRSGRRDRPLVKVNCAAITAGLVESELFGHVKGAFTGAIAARTGRFELADGGTIFLDEVGDLPPETQVKLLRVLQEQEFEPVGSSRTVRVNVRVIAATNRDLEATIREGRFRADLFYRLNVFPLDAPPLRQRRTDIPQLVTFFMARYAKRFGKKIERVGNETMERLMRYNWPGNIRDLQNVIERAVILSNGPLLEIDWDLAPLPAPRGPLKRDVTASADQLPDSNWPLPPIECSDLPFPSLENIERGHFLTALQKANWVVEGPHGAARMLNLNPSTFRSRMKKLGIARTRP
jgi:predicted ATPase